MSLKIEAGKYYRTRDGRKVGPMENYNGGQDGFSFYCEGKTYNSYGGYYSRGESQNDIIAEWRDQPTQTVTTNGRHYDLTKLETPPFFLPDDVYDALRRWDHGWVFFSGGVWNNTTLFPSRAYGLVVRAKPAPKETRVKCYRSAPVVPFDEYGTCIKNPDGSINWDTWEPEA